MKAVQKFVLILLGVIVFSFLSVPVARAQTDVSFQVFYDELSPYGYWVENPSYGYVWIPNVDAGFAPYSTNGYWMYTEVGWTWVSNYPWGWAPFHYGRWMRDPVYGSMWVPGNEWGPGWVTWRQSGSYYGWAPIEPGISISVAYSNSYRIPNDRWRFVRDRDFGRVDLNRYYERSSNNYTIINNSTVINNMHIDNNRNVKYNAGPDKAEVQNRTRSAIVAVPIRENSKPGQSIRNDQFSIYRPNLSGGRSGGSVAAPSRVSNLKEIDPAAKRKYRADLPATNQVSRGTTRQSQLKAQQNQVPQIKAKQAGGNSKSQPVEVVRDAKKADTPMQQKKQQPSQQQREQPAQQRREQPAQQRREQPAQQQPSQQRREQPAQQQPSQQKREQPAQQQPAKQRREQPSQQRREQPAQQQPPQQRREQPAQQQPSQQRREQQQPSQQRREPPKESGSADRPGFQADIEPSLRIHPEPVAQPHQFVRSRRMQQRMARPVYEQKSAEKDTVAEHEQQ